VAGKKLQLVLAGFALAAAGVLWPALAVGKGQATPTCLGKAATIVGTTGNDTITGTGGDDVIVGLGGDDTIDGGLGNDTICGNAGNDDLRGSDGNDSFEGGAGDDSIAGQVGSDTVSYAKAPAGVMVDLAGGIATGDGTDSLAGIENAVGSAFGDLLKAELTGSVLSGGASDDNLQGRDGNDTLNGGPGDEILDGGLGNDRINGGPGKDLLTYTHSPAGVTVVLIAHTATGGYGSDTLTGIEDVDGSNFADSLTGDSGPNVVFSGKGLDFLSGLGGNDFLVGDDAPASIDGGDGTDVCSVAASEKINCEGS